MGRFCACIFKTRALCMDMCVHASISAGAMQPMHACAKHVADKVHIIYH